MRKSTFLSAIAVLGIFLFWNFFYNSKSLKIASEESAQNKNEAEEEDGILLAQQQEFKMTRDISLGYIPKGRLINAYEDLMRQKNQRTDFTNQTQTLTWTERGPNTDAVGPSNGNGRPGGGVTSGRVRAIWVDLSDVSNHTVFVGGVDGGLWKTTNISSSPATWTLVNDFLGNLAIGSICQDPNSVNKDVMYFGTGEKTFNIDAVQGGGVWKSTDHGVTWSLLPSTTGFWNISKILCDAAGNVYIAAISSVFASGSTGGVFRSINGGTSWTDISPSGLSTRIPEMELSSTGRLHVTCGYYGIPVGMAGYRFTDNPSTITSGTWTSPTTSFSPVQYNVDLAVAGNNLYALPANSSYQTPQVWKSTDGGDNWVTTATSPPTGGSTPVSSGQAWYNLAIAVDPVTTGNVVVGGLNGYMSTDGGATWSPNAVWVTGVPGSTNYIHADHQVAVWNGNQVLVGSDGGIFYSGDGGVTFTDRNVGLRLKQFYSCAIHPSSTNYFLAGAQDNGVHQLNGAALTSSVEVTGGDGAFVHIDEDEPQYQYGSYVYSNYKRSINGGSTWSSVNFGNFGQFINPSDFDDINNNMYAADDPNYYQRWTNAHTNSTYNSNAYTLVSGAFGGGQVTAVSVSHYTSNRVFFGLDNGRIIKVDNAQLASPATANITAASMTTPVSCIAIGTSDNNLIATFSNYGASVQHVQVSVNGGTSWADITGNLPDIPVRWAMFFPEDNTKAIIATEMGVYETTNINGSSTIWTRDPSFPIVRTDMLQYRFSDNTILAATHGRGLWTSTISPAAPYVRFASSYIFSSIKTEATTATTGCRNYTDYTLNMHIDLPPTGAANVTLNIAGGATATQGIDYDFTTNGSFAVPSSILTFPNGSSADRPITIRIYNDAEVEGTESFTFNYTIGGGTNAVAAPSSPSYTFTIGDDDVAPVAPIETVLNNNKTEYLANNGTYYFYSSATGNIMNRLSVASASLGCVSSNIFEAGTTWQSFLGGQRSQKVFDITPTTNPGSSHTIGLYLTSAELGGKPPAGLRIAKTTAATMAAANAGNTVVVTTSFASYGTGDVFTASFSGFGKFFLIDAGVALPVTLLSFDGRLNNNSILLNWSTSSELNSKYFDLEKSSDGTNFYSIGTVNAAGTSTIQRNYNFTDRQVNEFNYYRLKMVDIDGHFIYSKTVLIKNPDAKQNVWVVNNPFRTFIQVRFAKTPQQKVQFDLVNMTGVTVYRKETGSANEISLDLSTIYLPAGIYMLRTRVDGRLFTHKLAKN